MAHIDTYQLAARFLSGYGLAECSVGHCCSRLTTFNCGEEAPLRLLQITRDPAQAIHHLSVLFWPDSRHVLFPVGDNHSALINNSRNGSDYGDYVCRLAMHLGSRFARIVDRPGRVWSSGTHREVMQYEARIFAWYAPSGDVIRSVDCVDDGGRWNFGEYGNRHPIESTFPYIARRKKDRFTSGHLALLIDAFGFPKADPGRFLNAGKYILFDISGRPTKTCTIEEADDPAYGYYQRGLGWVPHMTTHAASVIADFERCLRINPNYEPLVREALNEAYRVTGRAS